MEKEMDLAKRHAKFHQLMFLGNHGSTCAGTQLLVFPGVNTPEQQGEKYVDKGRAIRQQKISNNFQIKT